MRDPWERRLASLCTLGFSLAPTNRDTLVVISRDSADHVLKLTRTWLPATERAAAFVELRAAIATSLGEPQSCDAMPAVAYWRDRELLVAIDTGMPYPAMRWNVARALQDSFC